MTLMWATRGKDWGFRFLDDGGELDPLLIYKQAFADRELAGEFVLIRPEFTATRMFDPLGRTDHAGRIIPHDFVLRGQFAEGVTTLEDVQETIWPLVEKRYEAIWDRSV